MSPLPPLQRQQLRIHGIVQGVGFRPFVYATAQHHGLTGFVCNDSDGVTIEMQGECRALSAFVDALRTQAPTLSRIDEITISPQPIQPDELSFVIQPSRNQGAASASMSPYQGMCQACRREISDPHNRFYRYPFTNCTHCGPRYTLIQRLPYDRQHTAMAGFAMCPACAQAYHDPLDRRYHAQPVSCPHCGPALKLLDATGGVLATQEAALQQAAKQLSDGALLAVKGLGGYHLMCDATNARVVARLRQLKRRARKPLAVMMAYRAEAEQYVYGSEQEWALALSQARPITLLRKRETSSTVAELAAPGIGYLGVLFPYTPLHQLLLEACARPLVATSANLADTPIITEQALLLSELGAHIDGVLDHDRPILHSCDDSLVQLAGGRRQILRLARGYAPYSVPLPTAVPATVLAVGAEQKNHLAFAFGNQSLYSPYIGDQHTLQMQQHLTTRLAALSALYDLTPKLFVADQHPGYQSRRLAEALCAEQGGELLCVQHHHAHLLAVMAEHQHTGPVLGFAFDGTGFGEQGEIWGGELLLADVVDFKRLAHLRPFRLIGAEQAIREPVRQLLGLLLEYFSPQELSAMKIPALESLPEQHLSNLIRLWQQGRNAPLTSSMGRLFDAVACLLGLVERPDYEGEAGLLLEAAAETATPAELHFVIDEGGVIDPSPLLAQLIRLRSITSTEALAAGFLQAVVELILSLARRWPDYPLALSGGVFQNRYVMDSLVPQLEREGRHLLLCETLPLNDGGIAAGQLWYGIHHLQRRRLQQGDMGSTLSISQEP